MTLLPLLISAALASNPLKVSVGDPALLFSLPSINEDAALDVVGRPRVSLSDFTGIEPSAPARAVVIHFFEKPDADLALLDRIQRRYRNRGVQVLAVTTNQADLGTLSTELEEQKLAYPVLRDNHRVVTGRYGVDRMPMTVVIDADGRVFAIGNATGETLEGELDAELSPLVGK